MSASTPRRRIQRRADGAFTDLCFSGDENMVRSQLALAAQLWGGTPADYNTPEDTGQAVTLGQPPPVVGAVVPDRLLAEIDAIDTLLKAKVAMRKMAERR